MIFRTITNESTGAIKSIGLFGQSLSELKNNISTIKSQGLINTIFNTSTINEDAIVRYNNAIIEATANGATMAEKQQIMKSSMESTNKATAQLIGSTKGAVVEAEALTAAQHSSTLAARAQAVALKAVSVAGNMILFAVITKGIELVVNGFDNWIHRVEKANEAMNDAVSEYESAKSSLENINSELQEQNNKIDELLAKDKLTYTEKGQLEELQAITKELLLQQDIEGRRADKAAKEAADKAIDAYNKQYGKFDITEEALNEKFSYGYDVLPIIEGEDDIVNTIFAYVRAKELLEQSQKDYDNALENGEDTTRFADDLQNAIDAIDIYAQALGSSIYDLQEKRSALEDEYNKAIKKRESGLNLTSSEQNVIKTYDDIYNAMKLVYEYTDSNAWNNMEIANIFNTEGLEKTKEELIALAKAGELSPEALQSFPKLSAAIKDSELIVGEGSDAFEEFYNELMALADKQDLTSFSDDKQPLLSVSETIDQLNTRLKPSMDSIKSAWQNIFSDDGEFKSNSVDILSTCDSIKSKLDDMSELGLDVDYSAYDDFANVLSDTKSTEQEVKDAFNDLADSITKAALSGTEDFKTMKAVLENLGVDNSELVAFDALIGNPDALKEAGLDLVTATDDQITAFANKIIASSENAEQAIDMLRFHKEQCNLQEVNTADEVANLMTLAQNAGYTGEMIEYLTELEGIYQDVTENYDDFSADRIADKLARAEELKSLIADSSKKVEYNPDKVSGKNAKSASAAAKEVQKEADIMSELNSEMNKLQSAYKTLCDIRDTYNEQGRITVDQYTELTDMGFGFLANLIDENGQLGLNTNAFEKLSNAKLQEMQIQLARNAVDTINGIKNETEATEYLTYANENLRDAALDSTEALLYQAQAMAHLRGEQQ